MIAFAGSYMLMQHYRIDWLTAQTPTFHPSSFSQQNFITDQDPRETEEAIDLRELQDREPKETEVREVIDDEVRTPKKTGPDPFSTENVIESGHPTKVHRASRTSFLSSYGQRCYPQALD